MQPHQPRFLLATARHELLLHDLREIEEGLRDGYATHSRAVAELNEKRSELATRPIKVLAEFAQELKELGLREFYREWLEIQEDIEDSFWEHLPEFNQAIDNEIQHFNEFREREENKINNLKNEIEELEAEIASLGALSHSTGFNTIGESLYITAANKRRRLGTN